MLAFKPYNTAITPEQFVKKINKLNKESVLTSHEQLKNRVVHVRKHRWYYRIFYFDKNGVFQIYELDTSCEQMKRIYNNENMYITFTNRLTKQTISYLTTWNGLPRTRSTECKPDMPKIINQTIIHIPWLKTAISTLIPEESTIEDLIIRYNFIVDHKVSVTIDGKTSYKIDERFHNKYPVYQKPMSSTDMILKNYQTTSEVKNFIYHIERPIFERETDNKNKNTFDFIRIRLSIASKEKYSNQKQFIKNNLKDIASIALTKIQNTKYYQKYGIPINYLRLTNAIITIDGQLELLFCLKNIPKYNENKN